MTSSCGRSPACFPGSPGGKRVRPPWGHDRHGRPRGSVPAGSGLGSSGRRPCRAAAGGARCPGRGRRPRAGTGIYPRRTGACDRHRAPLPGVPRPVRGRLACPARPADAQPDRRGAGGRQEPGGDPPGVRGRLRRVGPARAGPPRRRPGRLVGACPAAGRRNAGRRAGRAPVAGPRSRTSRLFVLRTGHVPRRQGAAGAGADAVRGGPAVTPLALLVAVGLTAIAAVAVLWPYHRGSATALQRLADPLEDERRRALRHLRDLDEDRGAGKLDEAGYRDARAEAEVRAVAVLRALEAREGTGELAGSLREVRRPAPSGATRDPGGRLPGRRWPRRAVAALVGVVVAAGAAALLDGAVGDRGTGQMITGQAATGDAALGSPVAAPLEDLERRVRERPDDVAAHLTLAERYLDAGRLKEATVAYLGALKLDPSNVEANTQFGLLLFRSGLPEPGLRSVEQALAADPRYPEALYAKGLILFMGLRQPKAAVPSLRTYLQVAPFGEHRDLAEQLLELATADRPGP